MKDILDKLNGKIGIFFILGIVLFSIVCLGVHIFFLYKGLVALWKTEYLKSIAYLIASLIFKPSSSGEFKKGE